MFGLDYLLAPLEADEYIDRYRGARALHIAGERRKFDGLFDWNTVNDLLFSSRDFHGLRLIHDKRDLARHEFKRLDHWLEQGATLAIDGVDKVDPVLAKFASVLGHELNARVNINSYMSHPARQGFDIHADRHDVFIVQTEGEKDWSVFPPTQTFPLHRQRSPDPGEPPDSQPYLECRLTPGDVLYIPRGHWHFAVARSPSVHLTVGPAAVSASEFMLWWAHELMDGDEFYRRDLPLVRSSLLGGSRPRERLDRHFNEFRRRLKAMLDDDAMMNEYLVRYSLLHNTMPAEYRLPSAWRDGREVSSRTRISVRDDQKFVVHYDDDRVLARVVFRDNEIELSGIPRELLAAILSCQGSRAGRTCEAVLAGCANVDFADFSRWLVELRRAGLLILENRSGERGAL